MAERIGPGRPPRDPQDIIDWIEEIDDTGVSRTPVTVMDRVIETLASNGFMHDAAARAGIGLETLRGWRKKGVEAQSDLLAGRKRRSDLDHHTRRCVELAYRMERAEAEAKTLLVSTMTQLAVGGLEETQLVQTLDSEGKVTDRRLTVKKMLPSERAIAWMLTHRYPQDFAERIEVSGRGGGPIEVEISARERFLEAVARVRERRAVDDNGHKAIDIEPKALPNGESSD